MIAEVAERQALVQQGLSILELPSCGGAPLLALMALPMVELPSCELLALEGLQCAASWSARSWRCPTLEELFCSHPWSHRLWRSRSLPSLPRISESFFERHQNLSEEYLASLPVSAKETPIETIYIYVNLWGLGPCMSPNQIDVWRGDTQNPVNATGLARRIVRNTSILGTLAHQLTVVFSGF